METTRVPAARTAQEISGFLAAARASKIMQEFAVDGSITSLSFAIVIAGNEYPFRLPVRYDQVFRLLQARRTVKTRQRNEQQDREQAIRVAWRQLLRWVQAQFAMIKTGMVRTEEVFMPYLQGGDGRTLFEVAMDRGFAKALPFLASVGATIQTTK